jgi:large subunit ribosomal protein L21
MKAVIETGGKQYYVEEGTEIYVEKLEGEAGSEIDFDKVLMVNGVLGSPYLSNIVVKGEIVKHGKQRKIVIFKYRPKKSSHKKQGHRQPYTKVKITKVVSK